MTDITKELITQCEKNYNDVLRHVASEVIGRKKIFVMVTGASCAGKTTTTKKLREYFAESGVHAETISLDDFYVGREKTPLTPDGKPDYETIRSLDLPLLCSIMSDLAVGKNVRIPRFDFAAGCRSDEYEELSLDPGEVVIIEGLHALNPLLFEHVDSSLAYRVYLYAEEEHYDVKLLRRIVRDSNYRGYLDAVITFDMWDNVLRGENLYIKPYSCDADVKINTFFPYETRLLSHEGCVLLDAVDENSPYKAKAVALKKAIDGLEPIPYSMIPQDSLMVEFVKIV